jgi:hypothetical protein
MVTARKAIDIVYNTVGLIPIIYIGSEYDDP